MSCKINIVEKKYFSTAPLSSEGLAKYPNLDGLMQE